jgi:hypothetical protein
MGKELKKDQYTGGTIFVDHASSMVFIQNQVSLQSSSTVQSKHRFEQLPGNMAYASSPTELIMFHSTLPNSLLIFKPTFLPPLDSLLGNLFLIMTISINLMSGDVLSMSLIKSFKMDIDGHKLPKWQPRSRRSMFVGVSPDHSSTIGHILNIQTGSISPQYHVVYDDLFTTVPNSESGSYFETNMFDASTWERIVTTNCERYIDMEFDNPANTCQIPSLSSEWTSDPDTVEPPLPSVQEGVKPPPLVPQNSIDPQSSPSPTVPTQVSEGVPTQVSEGVPKTLQPQPPIPS